MGQYFGTDGVRGVANENLTTSMAYKVGRFLAYYCLKDGPCKIIIGKDTRRSSSMLEAAITSGCLESGADVYQLGYTTTPCVSYLCGSLSFSGGIMISASHNPYQDNGIKVMKSDGTKIDAKLEGLIEDYFINDQPLPKAKKGKIGSLYFFNEGFDLYLKHISKLITSDLSSLKVALDLANGSACYTAKRLFESSNIKADYFFDRPDGININDNCGSTHLENLSEIVKKGNYDVGFAFDGDADRVLALDEFGELIDGDTILYICGKYLKEKNELNDSTIVATVMSNIGLYKACKKEGIIVERTQVGDKYVYDLLNTKDYCLGGEQSGHIIFKQYANTGDGLLTAIILLSIMIEKKQSLSELKKELVVYPQLLNNIKVKDKNLIEDKEIKELVSVVEEELGENGRVLVRTSGTEELIRVMVEASSEELCKEYVDKISDLIILKDDL